MPLPLAYLAFALTIPWTDDPTAPAPTTKKTESVDKSYWIQDVVNLYYISDATALAKQLTAELPTKPKGKTSKAKADTADAATKPVSLTKALADHIDALNGQARSKDAVAAGEERVKAAAAAELSARKLVAIAQRRVESFDPAVEAAVREVESLDEQLEAAKAKVVANQSELSSLPTQIKEAQDPEVKKQLQEQLAAAKAEQPRLKLAQERAQRAADNAHQRQKDVGLQVDLAKLEKEARDKDLTSAITESTNAGADLSTAKSNLATASTTIATKSTALRESRAQAQLEASNRLDQFAVARRDQPVFQRDGTLDQNDPIARVDVSVYQNSRQIFLRGTAEDVRKVKEIIANFDRPTPQARVTLWTLEANLIGNKGRNALSDRSLRIEAHMNSARKKMSDTSRFFREAVSEEVAEVEDCHLKSVIDRVSLQKKLDGPRLARSFIYEPEVAYQLGLDLNKVNDFPEYYFFTRWTLPDPAATTTLGESVLVYQLGTRKFRAAVKKRFTDKIRAILVNKEFGASNSDGPRRFLDEISLGLDGEMDGLNAYQLEITRALKRSALDRFVARSPDLVALYAKARKKHSGIITSFIKQLATDTLTATPGVDQRQCSWRNHLVAPLLRAFQSDISDTAIEDHGISEELAYIVPSILWLREQFGVNVQVYGDLANIYDTASEPRSEYIAKCIDTFRTAYPTEQSNARIAAADEMLKRIMIAFEDDVQEAFVTPELIALKKELQGPSISVGSINRTSVIATNRAAARVEGNASAELDLAGQERLIDSALALADLITAAGKTNITGALQQLKNLDKEPASEFYAITSGSKFQITPIFDPSGQALRFEFDHIKNTNVLDSDGSNPALPRVDSHAASMTVQLSNMEIRELTRFESNVKLGSPEKRWGGIPFLNGIYPLSEIPIIGWFSRKAGRDAVSQTSIIFAQNAMYPTIGDLSNLLSSGFGIPPLIGSGITKDEKKKQDPHGGG